MARPRSMPLPDFEESILASPLLGGGLPAEAQHHLDRAAATYALGDVAETHFERAEGLAPIMPRC